MATRSEEQALLLEDDELTSSQALATPINFMTQSSIEFDVSGNSDALVQLLQGKDFTTEVDSDQSDEEEIISADCLHPIKKQLSFDISENGVQSHEKKDPALVLTDQRHLTKSSSYYGLLTCYRSLQAKDIRKKLDVIGIKKNIETGSYTAHTSEDLFVLYEFKNESFYNVMCSNLSSLVQKSIAKSTKRSDRIPMSLRPARPVYSKLKCCLELSLTPGSFSAAINTLHPLFVTLAQSLFYITANGTKEDDVTPCTPSVPEPNRIPAFALCLQFNKVIFKKTIKSFGERSWSVLNLFPSNKVLFCYANTLYGESMPYILCETGKESGMQGSSFGPCLAIYLFVSGNEEAMLEMKTFYDTLLLVEKAKSCDSKRAVYSLISEAYSDRELILLHVPDKTTVQQRALSLYVHTTNILSLICKLKRPVVQYCESCVCVYDPQGNRVVLRDLSHAPFFKSALPKLEFTT